MKSYTDIEQSKVLADILKLESSDTFYKRSIEDSCNWELNCKNLFEIKNYPSTIGFLFEKKLIIPAWSLNALLDVLPSSTLDSSDDHNYRLHCRERFTEWHDNPIDACVEMILRLNGEEGK